MASQLAERMRGSEAAPVAAGETLSARERAAIDRAARRAGDVGGLTFTVLFATAAGDARAYAEHAHARLDAPAITVLVFVDPAARRLEIVTGSRAHRLIDDRAAKLAALAMTSKFSLGDLAGGVVDGLQMLGEYANRPPVMHVDRP